MITREQLRAQAAFYKIKAAQQRPEIAESYGRRCLHLPALIHQCGLCQASTFLEAKAKKKPECQQLLDDILEVANIGSTEEIRCAEIADYQRMTREALACAQWFKRYAEAVLRAELGGDEED
jgi:CRISPR-associated protein Cmr5